MDEKVELKEILRDGAGSTPRLRTRRIEHEIELEDKKYDDHWQSCCMTIDRRATRYFSQLAIAMLIMVFCIVMLIRNDDCPSQQLYSGILMTIIGIMLPSPSLN
jgi:hypothetical protein